VKGGSRETGPSSVFPQGLAVTVENVLKKKKRGRIRQQQLIRWGKREVKRTIPGSGRQRGGKETMSGATEQSMKEETQEWRARKIPRGCALRNEGVQGNKRRKKKPNPRES